MQATSLSSSSSISPGKPGLVLAFGDPKVRFFFREKTSEEYVEPPLPTCGQARERDGLTLF